MSVILCANRMYDGFSPTVCKAPTLSYKKNRRTSSSLSSSADSALTFGWVVPSLFQFPSQPASSVKSRVAMRSTAAMHAQLGVCLTCS